MDDFSKDYQENYAVDVLTGVRPTANLTIANYLGAIKPLLELQSKGHSTVIFVADMHGLTDFEPKDVYNNTKEIIADYLALGINPSKVKIYIQSHISAELLDLTTLLLRHITIAELLRVPALKDKLKGNQNPENANVLLGIYPVLMAADILIQKAKFVPVGQDQTSHLEITKLLARRFNSKYGNVLPVPVTQIMKPTKILALKGEGKMSKSDPERAIFLTDSPEAVANKIKLAETANPGEMSPSLESHFNLALELCVTSDDFDRLKQIQIDHGLGKKVMSDFKNFLTEITNRFLRDFQQKRSQVLSNPNLIDEVIKSGNDFAKKNAIETMSEVNRAIFK